MKLSPTLVVAFVSEFLDDKLPTLDERALQALALGLDEAKERVQEERARRAKERER